MNQQPIPHDRTIYVSKYSVGTTVEQLRYEFNQFGNIETVMLNQNGKGVFIIFSQKESVTKALSSVVQINNTAINVSQYLDIEKLDLEANVFIENLDPKETQQSLKKTLSVYGEILSIKVHMSDKAGVAYIQFEKRDAADKCIADQQKLGFKIIKYAQKKHKSQLKRDQLYISNIKSNVTQEQLKKDLTAHFQEFGTIESIQVNLNAKTNQQYAFVKFNKPEDASLAIKSTKLFNNSPLQIEWVINSTDKEMEANLFTKNLKMSVTEEQLKEAYSIIVPIEDVKIMKPKITQLQQNKPITQKASLYFRSADDGKKAIDLALKTPQIFELYEKGTVLLSLLLPPHELHTFNQMKKNEKNLMFQQKAQQQAMQQQQFMQQYPPMNINMNQYPQQQLPRYQNPQYQTNNQNYNTNHNQRSYQNNNNYRPKRQPYIPDISQLENMVKQGQQKEVNDIIGTQLFPKVQRFVGAQQAPYVTGILLNFENYAINEQIKMINDEVYLNENIKQAMELLKQH